jgi:hypothetical protein
MIRAGLPTATRLAGRSFTTVGPARTTVLSPMFPMLISLAPARIGATHAANAVGFQITAAMLSGAADVSLFGAVRNQFGLEMLGPFLLAAAVLLAGGHMTLERNARAFLPPARRFSALRCLRQSLKVRRSVKATFAMVHNRTS